MLTIKTLHPSIRRLSERQAVISFGLSIAEDGHAVALRIRDELGVETSFIIHAELALPLAAELRRELCNIAVRDIRATPDDGRKEPVATQRFLDEQPALGRRDWNLSVAAEVFDIAIDPARDVFFLILRIDEYRVSILRINPALLFYLIDMLEAPEVVQRLTAYLADRAA